jgi:hypothetical protein
MALGTDRGEGFLHTLQELGFGAEVVSRISSTTIEFCQIFGRRSRNCWLPQRREIPELAGGWSVSGVETVFRERFEGTNSRRLLGKGTRREATAA